jgi:hypothetical protein
MEYLTIDELNGIRQMKQKVYYSQRHNSYLRKPTMKKDDKENADKAFRELIVPLLKSHGWNNTQIAHMAYRVRFGRDYKNWSVRVEDTDPNDVPLIERLVRDKAEHMLVLQAFINNNEVSSYSVTVPNLLAEALSNEDICIDQVNRYEKVKFRCVTFDDVQKMFGKMCFVYNG